ncbi:mycofactocin biosynthesis glycosyltransferase MftF, partial [Georgenia sp. 10Sc9-8]|nr:mycofactocin biosynthesis glycosyltransferase MftF [Georgenia halotolerans]
EDAVVSRPVVWTPEVALRAGSVVLGGSPWHVTVLPESVREFARRVHATGQDGATAATPAEQEAARFLLDRGIVHPAPIAQHPADDVEVVVPVYGDPGPLRRCLTSLAVEGLPVTVVDDASPEPYASQIAEVAAAHGARLVRQETNTGPGGARNTGLEATEAPFVAFMDADALASADWVARLRPVLDDERVGAVGPRVRPDVRGVSAIELYEETRSELDMGAVPSRVVHGVPVGWLPSAAVLVRRSAVTRPAFEPGLRVGEDVDLFWRMDEAGWTVLYAPDVVVHHEVRDSWKDFVGRRKMYGNSAALLEMRHPRRLTPASPSLSGLAVLAAASTGHPFVAAGVATYELARQRALLGPEVPLSVAVEVTGRSMWSDAYWMGHLLRRDWWPVGWTVLALTPRSSLARGVAAAMMWEPVRDHILRPTRLDPVRSLGLRLLDDASYGTGVIQNAIAKGVPNVVTPRPRLPRWPRRR